MIPKALAGHHPPPGSTTLQPSPTAPTETAAQDTGPLALLVVGILLAACIGGFVWSVKKK